MDVNILFCVLCCFFSLFALSWLHSRQKGITRIPGPTGIPFLGFLVHFVKGSNYQRKLIELKAKYGNICRIQMGSYTCVFLNDSTMIREAWSIPAFCGRPKIPSLIQRTRGISGGINFNNGASHTEQKRFAIKHLKDFGFGSKSMESSILDEVLELTNFLKTNSGVPISTRKLFNVALLNALWTITTGQRYNHDDHELNKMAETLKRNLELNNGAKLAFFIPWLAKMFPKLSGWQNYIDDAKSIFDFWQKFADSRIAKFTNHPQNISEVTNFTDLYIQKIKSCADETSSFYGKIGEIGLAITLQDLFNVGNDTISTTLSWAFLYLATFQNVQSKIKEEIINNIGKSRTPSLDDRQRMIYTEAFLLETMRFGTLTPLGMIHSTTEDVNFQGYFVPKDTIVMANICAVHHDPVVWGDSENFRPERFIADGVNKIKHYNGFLAFSCGKRSCPGEALVKNQLFLFVTTILQKFQVEFDPSSPFPSLQPVIGASSVPIPHQLVFQLQ